MGLVSYYLGKQLIKFVTKNVDLYTQATSAAVTGDSYNPKRYAAYALVGENVKKLVKSNPKTLSIYVSHNFANEDISIGVYALTPLYHDAVFSELRSGKYHSRKGVLDKDNLGPYLVEAVEGIINLAINENVYPGTTKEEMMHSINFAIESTPSETNNDRAMLMVMDLLI